MSDLEFSFVTDTATLCVCDSAALKHRLNDDADWWCGFDGAQTTELNDGNAAFLDLGSDGRYFGSISAQALSRPQVTVQLSTPGRKLFVGAAEEVTSGGMEPDCTRGGVFFPVAANAVVLQASRSAKGEIRLSVQPLSSSPRNFFSLPLRLT